MTLTTRALPGPFDPPAGPLTVATPSCCCCCCCCLATAGAVMGVTAGEAYHRANENGHEGRRRALAIVLGLLTVPAAVLAVVVVGPLDVGTALTALAAFVAVVVVAGAALGVSGVAPETGFNFGAAVALIAVPAFLVEAIAALFTFFILELLAPFAFWAGLRIARSMHESRFPPPPEDVPPRGRWGPPGGGWPAAPPPPPPPLPGVWTPPPGEWSPPPAPPTQP